MHSVDANPSTCSTSGECLTYDALGRMVEKTVGSTYTQIVYGPQGRFATMNGQTFVSAFIPLPGAQAVYTNASLNTTNKVAYYRHTDHLGSSRLATTPTQTLYSSTAYAPYGEPYSQAGATDLSFTGQEQDTVSGVHDFPARKYPPVQGRWLSPDPAGLGAADPANPQSWNRYAYVLNNPLSLVDPLGLTGCSGLDSGSACAAAGQPDLAAMTGSGSACGGGACGADAYAAYQSYVSAATWVYRNTVTVWGYAGSFGHNAYSVDWDISQGAFWVATDTRDPGLDSGEIGAGQAAEVGLPGLGISPAATGDAASSGQTEAQIFHQAYAEAKQLLKNRKCKNFFRGVGAARMDATHYSARSASFFTIRDALAETTGLFSVVINRQSGFYSGSQVSFALSGGGVVTVTGGKGVGAFVLLHELGHQLDEYTHFVDDSSGSNQTEGQNNQLLLDNCFSP